VVSESPVSEGVAGQPVLTACVVAAEHVGADAVAACVRQLATLVDTILVAGPQPVPAPAVAVPIPAGSDLPAARAALLAAVETSWVLWADPELTYDGSRLGLWCALAAAREPALGVVTTDPLGAEAAPVALHRRTAGTWTGRVRPRLIDAAGRRVGVQRLPLIALAARRTLKPSDTERVQRREAELALARLDVDDAVAAQQAGTPLPPTLVAAALETLAGCQHDAGRAAEAEATRTALAEMFPGTDEARRGLDLLARTLLLAGRDADVVTVVDRLRAQGGVDTGYCDWLAAQAFAQLGRTAQAWELAAPLGTTRDTTGNEVDPALFHETRALIGVAAGQLDAAVDDLVVAMTEHGQIAGRGPLLRELWSAAGRNGDPLDHLLQVRPDRAKALRNELGVAVAA
jgi:hypothetical protein